MLYFHYASSKNVQLWQYLAKKLKPWRLFYLGGTNDQIIPRGKEFHKLHFPVS